MDTYDRKQLTITLSLTVTLRPLIAVKLALTYDHKQLTITWSLNVNFTTTYGRITSRNSTADFKLYDHLRP